LSRARLIARFLDVTALDRVGAALGIAAFVALAIDIWRHV
jgi:hypothetical protein